MLEVRKPRRPARHAAILDRCTDDELIEGILQGDPRAQEAFMERYRRLIYRILYQMNFSHEDVEDLRQEVFVSLWAQECRCLRRWQGRGRGKFSSYLAIIVRRTGYEARRSRPPDTAPEGWEEKAGGRAGDLPDPAGDLVAAALRRERAAAVRDALSGLSPRDQELIRRKHDREQSYREIAAALGMTVNHVGVALARAEDRLRRALCQRSPGLFAAELPGDTL